MVAFCLIMFLLNPAGPPQPGPVLALEIAHDRHTRLILVSVTNTGTLPVAWDRHNVAGLNWVVEWEDGAGVYRVWTDPPRKTAALEEGQERLMTLGPGDRRIFTVDPRAGFPEQAVTNVAAKDVRGSLLPGTRPLYLDARSEYGFSPAGRYRITLEYDLVSRNYLRAFCHAFGVRDGDLLPARVGTSSNTLTALGSEFGAASPSASPAWVPWWVWLVGGVVLVVSVGLAALRRRWARRPEVRWGSMP